MAFSLSGSTITQSGTDTSLAGLTGIAGVTVIANGDGNIYSFPTLVLNIAGTLTISNPGKETIVASAIRVLSGGNYTSGTFCADGVTPKTNGVHFKAVGVSAQYPRVANSGAFEVQSGGQSKLIGGVYYVSGGITYLSGAINIEEIGVAVVASRAFGADSARIFYGTPNISKLDVKHYDIGVDLFQKPAAGRPFIVKSFGSDSVSHYVSAQHGGTDALFTASALSNQDGTYDFDNYGGGWIELYDCAKGASLNVVNLSNSSNHCVPLYQNVNIKVTNLNGEVQNNVLFKLTDNPVNSPTTTITTNGGTKTWDFRNNLTYTGNTNSSGLASFAPCLQVWHGASNTKNLRFPASTITPEFRAYGLRTQSASLVLGSDTAQTLTIAMSMVSYLTMSEAVALALPGITFTPSGATGGTVTLSANRTASELWQAYRAWIVQLANTSSSDTWNYNGSELNTGAWNVSVGAGVTFTGDMKTTGVITLANGATFVGTRTDANGTVAPPKTVSITGLTAGSRLRVYNNTTATEVVNQIVAGTSYSATYNEGTGYTAGNTLTITATWQSGTSAKLPFSTQVVVGSAGWSALVNQQNDTVYNGIGINGSTITEFTPDYPNVQVDISDPNGQTSIDRLYSWFVSVTTSADGIRNWFGGIVAEDAANFRVVTSILNLKLDNLSANGVEFTGGQRLYRDDNASPLVASTTGGGSISLYAGKVYTSVVSTSSPVITGDISQVPAAVQSGMTAQGYTIARAGNMDRLDANISTRLAEASYTAPPSAANNANAVRTELTTELTRIDVAVSTRTQSGSTVNANVTQVNGIVIDGVGTEANPWGPVE